MILQHFRSQQQTDFILEKTLTLVGDLFLGTFLTLIADRFGRRKILFGGSFLMIMTGVMFALFENFWILLIAAVVGVVSATGGDFGPFRTIEESMLSQLTTPTTRSDVLAWYVTSSAFGSSIGSELGGRIIEYLRGRGLSLADSYHGLFWIYAVMGVVNAGMALLLTKDCEAGNSEAEKYSQVPQNDDPNDDEVELEARSTPAHQNSSPEPILPPVPATGIRGWIHRWMGPISTPTLKIVYKLWILLAIDSLADGMVPYSLTNYYLDGKFHPSKSTLGDTTSAAFFLTAIGGVFAGPLARKIGLVNTMVFTHIPSSAAVLLFPIPNHFWMAIILLFVRAALNNMDQAPRAALIAAVVRPEERTAVMGITAMLRTLAATSGPMVTGFLAGGNRFWVAFVAGGAFRLTYDVGLWVIFRSVKLHQHEGGDGSAATGALARSRESEEETFALHKSDDEDEDDEDRASGSSDTGRK
jgi:MFS family permease